MTSFSMPPARSMEGDKAQPPPGHCRAHLHQRAGGVSALMMRTRSSTLLPERDVTPNQTCQASSRSRRDSSASTVVAEASFRAERAILYVATASENVPMATAICEPSAIPSVARKCVGFTADEFTPSGAAADLFFADD